MAGLADVVATGTLRTQLEAQRDALAKAIDACAEEKPDKVAPLHARLTDVLVRLDSMEAPKESKLDELAAARAQRRKRGA